MDEFEKIVKEFNNLKAYIHGIGLHEREIFEALQARQSLLMKALQTINEKLDNRDDSLNKFLNKWEKIQ